MTSASGPPWAKKLASIGPVSRTWKLDWTAAGSKPAAARLGCQTGIQPPLTTMAIPWPRCRVRRPSGRAGSIGQQHDREQHIRDQDQPHSHGVRNAAPGSGAASSPKRAPAAMSSTGHQRSRTSSRLSSRPPAARPRPNPRSTRGRAPVSWLRRKGPGRPPGSQSSRPHRRSGARLGPRRAPDRPARAPTSSRDEGIHDVRIELDPAELAQLGQAPVSGVSGVMRYGADASWPRRVGDVEDSGELGDLVATSPSGIAGSVEPLVVVKDDR